jgi:transcriptional regulator with XRE-family HTH domain
MTRSSTLLAAPRRATGFTQRALAARSGRKQPVIARIEAGASDTTIDTLDALLLPTGHRVTAVPTLRTTVAEAALELSDFVAAADDDAAFRTIIQVSDTLAAAEPVERVVLSAAPAPPTGGHRYDALLAAVVEHHLAGLPVPRWVAAAPTLAEPWHVDPYTERHPEAAATCIPAGVRRNVFLSESELDSV